MTDPMPAIYDSLNWPTRLRPPAYDPDIPQLYFSHAIATLPDEQEAQDD